MCAYGFMFSDTMTSIENDTEAHGRLSSNNISFLFFIFQDLFIFIWGGRQKEREYFSAETKEGTNLMTQDQTTWMLNQFSHPGASSSTISKQHHNYDTMTPILNFQSKSNYK